MKPIIGPHQRTTEWYALRRNADDPRFGATDAAVLLGESRYKTPRHLYEEFIEPPPPMDNDAMRSHQLPLRRGSSSDRRTHDNPTKEPITAVV